MHSVNLLLSTQAEGSALRFLYQGFSPSFCYPWSLTLIFSTWVNLQKVLGDSTTQGRKGTFHRTGLSKCIKKCF